MTTARGRKAGAVLVAGILTIGCDGPTRPGPVAPAPLPPAANPLAALAGSYTLTIEIPDACAELPEEERRRSYNATLELSPYSYLGIRIVGAGYAVPTPAGDMWNNGDGRVKLDWNNFDIGGCDGKEESLADGGTLMICGNGVGLIDGTTIAATLFGEVRFATPGRAQVSCHHGLTFTFQRAAAGAGSR